MTPAIGLPDESALEERTLSNGLRVVLAPRPHGSLVAVGFFVKAGSRYEDARTAGLAHFVEHMLFRGTTRHRSTHALARAFAELGGDLDAATHVDFTRYELVVPYETVVPAIAELADVFTSSLFEGIGVEKRVIREELLRRQDEDGHEVDVDGLARQLVFGESALGRPIAGSIENVERFERRDVEKHLARYYVGRNAALVVAGRFDTGAVLDAIERAFVGLPEGEPAIPVAHEPVASRRRFDHLHDPGNQTDVRLSYRTVGHRDADEPVLDLLVRILDDGFASRVNRRICDERGLAYEAFAGLELYEDCGIFDLGATVAHENAPAVLRELFGLTRELVEADVSAADLELARTRLLVQLRATADDPIALVHRYGTAALFGRPVALGHVAASVERVGPERLREVAGAVFRPDRARVACVGVLEGGLEARLRAIVEDERRARR